MSRRKDSSIDGLDRETASEIQGRAANISPRSPPSRMSGAASSASRTCCRDRRRHPGHAGRHGEAGILTVEDLAGCATDDLTGWTERKQGETVKHEGAFSGLEVLAAEAEAIIMAARVTAGWIEPQGPEQPLEQVTAE